MTTFFLLYLPSQTTIPMKKILLLAILAMFTVVFVEGKTREKRSVVRLETSAGNIRIALSDDTPAHRDNFLKLAATGFYDGTLFHRVIKDFMIQGGDPESKGAPRDSVLGEGSPGYLLPPEIDLPYQYHLRGAVAMAREGDEVNPDRLSNGSQFYIVWGKKLSIKELDAIAAQVKEATDGTAQLTRDMKLEYLDRGGAPHLDGQYTVFGEVIEGMDVVERIQAIATDNHDRPLEDVVIRHAVVEQKSKKAEAAGQRKRRI